MNGQAKLQTTAIVIGAIVIVAMAAAFILLFLHYARQRRKVVDGGLADAEIDQEVVSIHARVLKRFRRKAPEKPDIPELNDNSNSRTVIALQGDDPILSQLTYKRALYEDENHRRSLSVVSDIVYAIFVVILLALAAFGIYIGRSSDGVSFIGDRALLVVLTGSMETRSAQNDYLVDNDLDDQIEQYSLITLDKVTDTSDLDLYDVIAFYDYDGNVIVHRVVALNSDGTVRTRGDANSGSSAYELNIGSDRLIGVWTGWQNYGLGITTTYLKSTMGIIALAGAGIFLLAYCVAEDFLDRAWRRGLEKSAVRLDNSHVPSYQAPGERYQWRYVAG